MKKILTFASTFNAAGTSYLARQKTYIIHLRQKFTPIKKVCALLLLISFLQQAAAKYQPVSYPGKLGMEANFQAGRVFRHTINFQPTISGPSFAGELSMFKQTDGSKVWQRKLHYPEIGGTIFMVFHHNHDTIGNGYAAYVYWKYALVRSKLVDFHMKLGIGLAYATKKYDVVTNPRNNVIGSNINACVQIRFGLDWKIAKQFRLLTAFTFSHYSDGAVKLPNLGINTPTGTIGLVYYPGNKELAMNRESFKKKPDLMNEVYGRTTFGMMDPTKTIDDKIRFMQSTSAGYTRYLNITNKISIGTTLEFNFAEPYIYVNTLEAENKRLKKAATDLSIHISDEVLIGRVAMHFEVGTYIYHTYRVPLPVYFKIGGACYLPDMGKKKRSQMMVLGNVKTHGAIAQLVEGGIGGTWKF